MATKKKAGKPAGKKAVNVKKIAPAKKAAAKPAHSSGNGKSAKKAPAAKSIAKPTAKKVAPSPKRSTPAPTKKGAVSSIAKPAVSHPKASIGSGKVQPVGSGKVQPIGSGKVQSIGSGKVQPIGSGKVQPIGSSKVQLGGKPASAPSIAKTQPLVKTQPAAKPQPVIKPQPVAPSTPPPTAFKPEPKKPTTPPKQVKVVIPEIKTKTVRKYEPEFTKSVLDTPQEEQTGPIMRYSDSELGEFRELINRKLDAAKKELAYLQGLITRKDEMGGDNDDARYMTMEDGSMSMEREQLSQMASRQITFIDHLEKALMRIENKTYGICRVTGKLIDKARLRAVPHATLSIEAKQMMNK
jgi:RNA polymerase-binding transcription factor DksA